jgi:hypothetical protein
MSKEKKERPLKQQKQLFIKGSFDDVLKASVPKEKEKDTKKK